uniref:Si:ch73-74h11.1 n=1 Tax=Amphilophus citrinellus TaxID=61819 RepID=A0A3Q0QS60_AMPCI
MCSVLLLLVLLVHSDHLFFPAVSTLLSLSLVYLLSVFFSPHGALSRNRREWILPPAKLMENIDYTHLEYIAKIRSDKDSVEKVEYFLSGEGADKKPFNLFVVDRLTGFVRVTGILDRENCPYYNLTGIARYRNGTTAESNIPLAVTVLDQNDNAPSFELHTGNITEASKKGTFVMQLKGEDKDQAGTKNAQISYKIASQEPEGTGHMFNLDESTGKLYVKKPTLDREVSLVVTAHTMEVAVYSGSVDENVENVVVMKIRALDKDQEFTDNWLTVFTIAKGNEDNLFSIETDNKTNEGILKLIKQKPGKPPKSYPVKIAVNNVPEGPAFIPDTRNIPVSEDPNEAPQNGLITVFVAIDPDSGKPAEEVSYAKGYDPDNWFTIDEETAEIKLNKVLDRESPFLRNGTYIGKILAISKDMPSKTATGTIAIQVADSNDHCPTLTTTHTSLCSDKKSVYVTGIDEDVSPNAAPFTFRIIPDGTRGSWVVEVINETSAALHSSEPLWPGPYELQVEVLDAQGLSCPSTEVFTVDVCTCVETKDCSLKTAALGTTSSKLAAPAIGLLLMASCLLIFVPLVLLLCQCGGADKIFPDKFSEVPFYTKEHLISYHTEGRGEDKVGCHFCLLFLGKILLMFVSFDNSYTLSRESVNYGNGPATLSRNRLGVQHTTALYEDITLPDAFLNDYYSQVVCLLILILVLFIYLKQKALCAVPAENTLLEYNFEGEGSSAGSVGCCSLLENDDDLHTLTDFGPKFKNLAEICIPPSMTPKTILPHNVIGSTKSTVGFIEPVSKTRLGHIVETKHADIKTEKVMSSINKQQSSVNTVSTAPSMTPPHAKITRISRSSNINHSDKLPSPIQTVLIQQQPIYHTRPVLQPVQYVVQPHLKNTLLLVDGSNRTNLFLIQDNENSENPASSSLPASPSLFMPNSPAVSLGSVEDWKIMQLNEHDNYMLIKDKSSPD